MMALGLVMVEWEVQEVQLMLEDTFMEMSKHPDILEVIQSLMTRWHMVEELSVLLLLRQLKLMV